MSRQHSRWLRRLPGSSRGLWPVRHCARGADTGRNGHVRDGDGRLADRREAGMSKFMVGRQPIFDTRLDVRGYELQIQESGRPRPGGDAMTADVLGSCRPRHRVARTLGRQQALRCVQCDPALPGGGAGKSRSHPEQTVIEMPTRTSPTTPRPSTVAGASRPREATRWHWTTTTRNDHPTTPSSISYRSSSSTSWRFAPAGLELKSGTLRRPRRGAGG